MLKITITETQTESRWILQGRLLGPWVKELRRYWEAKHTRESGKRCVVDLNDVTAIDKTGERLLRAMSKTGADLISNGLYTKHLLEKLKAGKNSLPMTLLCLCVGLGVTVIRFAISP